MVFGSLLLIPVLLAIHPPIGEIAHGLLVPQWPAHSDMAAVMLLVIGIVGTTVAPWQLFFQQSYVVDKRITPAFNGYEKVDLCLGILLVVIGAVAMMAFCAALFAGRPEFGNFTDTGAVLTALDKYVGPYSATIFAIALLDACLIGAAAVSLSTSYAIADVLRVRHSLHRKVTDAIGFYVAYGILIFIAAGLVAFASDALLGLFVSAVQALAGVLLPSATVFLLLLCNDKAVVGPWSNGPKLNVFTGAIIWSLVLLSIILTVATVFPDVADSTILKILIGGSLLGLCGFVFSFAARKRSYDVPAAAYGNDQDHRFAKMTMLERRNWRMPPLNRLPALHMTLMTKVWMGVLRGYLLIAVALIGFKVFVAATGVEVSIPQIGGTPTSNDAATSNTGSK